MALVAPSLRLLGEALSMNPQTFNLKASLADPDAGSLRGHSQC